MSTYAGYVTLNAEGEYADVRHMQAMPVEGYVNYIRESLFWVDHHGVLRDAQVQFPIATSREQLAALIRFLKDEVDPKLER